MPPSGITTRDALRGTIDFEGVTGMLTPILKSSYD
jgi:hypothetical protein